MDTLGSLFDKLTIVKLKQWHTDNVDTLRSLTNQEAQLITEIDSLFNLSITGNISLEQLVFSSNKLYVKGKVEESFQEYGLGLLISKLAETNCKLWHCQEKVYEFERVPVEEKDSVVKELAVLNLERNKCIDEIDKKFCFQISEFRSSIQST